MDELPCELLQTVCAGAGGVEDLRRVMLASKRLRQPAADSVRTLVADAGALPAGRAWQLYRRATGLLIRQLRPDASRPLEAGAQPGRLEGRFAMPAAPQDEAGLLRLLGTLAALPARVQAVEWPPEGQHLLQLPHSLCCRLAAALAGSRCSGSLRRLQLDAVLSARAAGDLAAGLPGLQSLDLVVRPLEAEEAETEAEAAGAQQGERQSPWRPALPAGLTTLRLNTGHQMSIDGAAIGAATRLQVRGGCPGLPLCVTRPRRRRARPRAHALAGGTDTSPPAPGLPRSPWRWARASGWPTRRRWSGSAA